MVIHSFNEYMYASEWQSSLLLPNVLVINDAY